jgi:hypothetical protein
VVRDQIQPPADRPRGVLVIGAILLLEAAGSIVLGVASAATVVGPNPVSVGGSAFLAVLLVLVACALVAMARKLAAGFRWPRSPSLVVQLFMVILAFPFFSAGNPLIGLLLVVPAAAVIVTLFSRPVVGFTVLTAGNERTL